MYCTVVHIHAIRIKQIKMYFVTSLKVQALVLDLHENGMWMLEHLRVKGAQNEASFMLT